MSNTKEYKLEAFSKLLDVLDELRVKCPWDRKQTNESLRCNTIEEVYELSNALLDDNSDEIRKELGDVLLHIIFYAKIADEKGQFDIADVCDSLRKKLIFRHPHVFGTVNVKDSSDVEHNWEAIKLKEKGGNRTILAGVPGALPSMIKAERIQEKASNAGFDWEQPSDVWNKVKEINAARLYKVNADNALEATNKKFISRFNFVEAAAKDLGKSVTDMTLQEMDELWDKAKELENNISAE